MRDKKSSLRIILHSIINFLILIILLIVANLLVSSINNSTYLNIVGFFNSLLGLFFLIFLVGMINNLFWNFEFPLNLLAPICGGVLGVFIVNLVYKILEFTQTFVYFNTVAKILSYNIYALVFFITIIIGYLIIFNEESRIKERSPKQEVEKKENKKIKKHHKSESNISWEDVSDEFKKVFLNIGKAFNSLFDGRNKREKNRKK